MNRVGHLLATAAIAVVVVVPRAIAQDAATTTDAVPGRPIEEIVVTAQKREQALGDVPISLSVLDDDFLAAANVTDFRDVSLYVPNVTVNNAANQFMDIRIRGFGSPISNVPFEQSVGLVIDGIPYSVRPYWQGPIFDLDRVEVLRGPQGTLFGKNTTAGLFNVVTKQPTDEVDGFVAGELGELDHRRFEGAVGGPLVAGILNFRLSGLSDERNGFVRNTTHRTVPEANERTAGRERQAVRAQAGFPNVFGANLVIGYERIDLETHGSGWELASVFPNHVSFFREHDPNVDLEPDNFVGSTEQPERRRIGIDTVVANGAVEVGEWSLALVTGHSVLDQTTHDENDFTPAAIVWNAFSLDTPQSVAELRATSPSLAGLFGLDRVLGLPLGRSDLVAGVFFLDQDVDLGNEVFLNAPALGQFVAADRTGVTPPCPACRGSAAADSVRVAFDSATTSYAGFVQASWTPLERWTLEYGMRLAQEEKEATWQTFCGRSSTECAGFVGVFRFEEFTAARERSEFAVTPKVSLRFDWTDDVNAYATWGRGFKSGGFNATVFNDNAEEGFRYEPERAASWELGTKATLFDGAANLNLALYRETVTDLQVFTTTPDLVFLVENAGEARSQGVEADVTWVPLDWLTVRSALAFNDTEYVEFPHGPCSFDRADTDGDGDSRCDLSGRPFEFTPKWTSTTTSGVRLPLGSLPGLPATLPIPSGLVVISDLAVEFRDNHYANQTLDPRTRQESFLRLGGSIGLGDRGRGWSARVVGKNLTDEVTAIHIRDVSVVGKSFAQIPEPPRLFFGEIRYQF